MKALLKSAILITFCTLLLLSCDTNDDGYYNSQFISIPNLVAIETQPTYSANGYLYINTNINRLQTEVGQTSLLDLRESTGNANAFVFTYLLERQINATDWALVDASGTNVQNLVGEFQTGSFYNAKAIFNTNTDSYKFRAGIKLPSAGQYRLSFGYNSSSTNLVELRSESTSNNLFLNIDSVNPNLNSDGYYTFTVN